MRRLTIILCTAIVLLTVGTFGVFAQQVHVVQQGETLFRIAYNYGRSVTELAAANGLAAPYLIHAGNQVIIPDLNAPAVSVPADTGAPAQAPATTATYVVQRGDSLATIARKYGINYLELASMNGIANPDVLFVGQVLRVPGPAAQHRSARCNNANNGASRYQSTDHGHLHRSRWRPAQHNCGEIQHQLF